LREVGTRDRAGLQGLCAWFEGRSYDMCLLSRAAAANRGTTQGTWDHNDASDAENGFRRRARLLPRGLRAARRHLPSHTDVWFDADADLVRLRCGGPTPRYQEAGKLF